MGPELEVLQPKITQQSAPPSVGLDVGLIEQVATPDERCGNVARCSELAHAANGQVKQMRGLERAHRDRLCPNPIAGSCRSSA